MRALLPLVLPAILAPAASAQYLINPAGGTVLSAIGDDEVLYANRPLGFTARTYFGEPRTEVDLTVNGMVNFVDANSASNRALPFPFYNAIMPFWADLIVGEHDRIIEKVSPGVYYAATWEVSVNFVPGAKARFQFVWFGAETAINGITFLPGDIVFCYGAIDPGAYIWGATAGLNAGDGDAFTALPRDPRGNGTFQSGEIPSIFPNYADSGTFVLFRPAGPFYAAVEQTAHLCQPCPIDFNADGFVDFFDYGDFVQAFEQGC